MTEKPLLSLSPPTGAGIVIDLGTGDGLFVYQAARANPTKFFIGIDANPRPLEKLSEKIHRKPAKGGLPNVLFLQAAVEDLPPELDGIANEVHIHFPWGSLLRAVALGDEAVLRGLRRLCAPGGLLEIVLGLHPERDRTELDRLGLTDFSREYVAGELSRRYEASGFKIVERSLISPADWPHLTSSWAKRLRGGIARELIYLIAQATGD